MYGTYPEITKEQASKIAEKCQDKIDAFIKGYNLALKHANETANSQLFNEVVELTKMQIK
jgi:hypothetical protein